MKSTVIPTNDESILLITDKQKGCPVSVYAHNVKSRSFLFTSQSIANSSPSTHHHWSIRHSSLEYKTAEFADGLKRIATPVPNLVTAKETQALTLNQICWMSGCLLQKQHISAF